MHIREAHIANPQKAGTVTCFLMPLCSNEHNNERLLSVAFFHDYSYNKESE